MQHRTRARRGASVALATAMLAAAGAATSAASSDADSDVGRWQAPFAEPTINGQPTDEVCVEEAEPEHDGTNLDCKPTATSLAVLGPDDVVYWDGLEDTEEVELSIVGEFGTVTTQDQVRRLDLAARTWTPSDPDEGQEVGDEPNELIDGTASTETYNDDVLFCASLALDVNGRVITAGGTTYYNEPDLDGTGYGVVELQGSKATRVYDPATNSWSRLGDMTWGRWYPTLVPQADGDLFVAGGVTKLMKPLYNDRDAVDSGRNVVQTETLDLATGEWTENPDSADRTLPLYPRLHVLPNGAIYYNAAGQVYNPQGQAYDEALWNIATAYDPVTQTWSDLGVPGAGTPAPGFRGSTTSVMLPLRPDEDGAYTEASFLTAGGILGTTPGTYFAVTDARVDTVDTTDMSLSSTSVGSLNQPRWYGQGVLLPTGEVFLVNGAMADEVVGPGTSIPVLTPELWNPDTGEFTQVASQSQARTYHNSAALLPDGSVLVGGHDPISTGYTYNQTLIPGTTTPQETRNPTFEIYEPPYLFRGDRPEILRAPATVAPGDRFTVALDIPGDEVDSVMLVRRTAITHLVDGGQRAVELPVSSASGNTITVAAPPDSAVAPAGPYLLFVSRATEDGPVPSVAADVTVEQGAAPTQPMATPAFADFGIGVDDLLAASDLAGVLGSFGLGELAAVVTPDLDAAGAVLVMGELAFHEAEELAALADDEGHTHTDDGPTYADDTDDSSEDVVLASGAFALGAGDLARRRQRSRSSR